MTSVAAIVDTERRLERWVGDIPSADGGGGQVGFSDRTGNTASRLASTTRRRQGDPSPDPAWRDLAHLREIRARITSGTDTRRDHIDADKIIHRWAELNPEQEAKLRSAAAEGDPGCRSCARISGPSGLPLWEPCHPGSNMCQWCIRTLQRIRVYKGHINDEVVWPPVLRWRQNNPGRNLSPETLDKIMRGS